MRIAPDPQEKLPLDFERNRVANMTVFTAIGKWPQDFDCAYFLSLDMVKMGINGPRDGARGYLTYEELARFTPDITLIRSKMDVVHKQYGITAFPMRNSISSIMTEVAGNSLQITRRLLIGAFVSNNLSPFEPLNHAFEVPLDWELGKNLDYSISNFPQIHETMWSDIENVVNKISSTAGGYKSHVSEALKKHGYPGLDW